MSHDTLRVRLLAFLFLIPLALYAWSAVQAFRVDSTLRDEQFMRDWSASARNDPDAADAIPRHLFRPAYGVEGHLHQFAEDAEAIRRDHPWLALRGWLAAIGKLCALASALVAAALLARLEYDGRRSMRSQAYLLGHLAPAWRRLGRLVPLHAGLLVAALASQLLYEALWSYSHWHSHGFVALLFSLPLWLLFLGGLLMLRRLRRELLPLEEPVLHLLGRELDRVAAPGLWQWLGQIADRAGAPLPDHVVTGIEHCYFVTQAKVLLAPRGIPLEGRTLYIPLTYATVMSEAESAAIDQPAAHRPAHATGQPAPAARRRTPRRGAPGVAAHRPDARTHGRAHRPPEDLRAQERRRPARAYRVGSRGRTGAAVVAAANPRRTGGDRAGAALAGLGDG